MCDSPQSIELQNSRDQLRGLLNLLGHARLRLILLAESTLRRVSSSRLRSALEFQSQRQSWQASADLALRDCPSSENDRRSSDGSPGRTRLRAQTRSAFQAGGDW